MPIAAAVLLITALVGGGLLWTPDKDRGELEARYAAPPSRFVQAAGLRVHVRDTGATDGNANAPTLLLLHGFGASLHTWEPWAQLLSAHYRVIRIDLPGSGLTGADPGGDYSDAHAMLLLSALLDELGVAKVTLVGHSMGGRLAWRYAAEQPQRVTKLVLIAPDGFASPGFEYGKAPEVPAPMRLMQYVLPKALLRASLKPAYADPALLTDATVDRYYDMVLAPHVRSAVLDRMQQMRLEDPRPWLSRIQAPTLLLWGERDAMIPLAHAQDYLQALPHARLVSVPGVGHLPHEEAPAASLPVLLDFLHEPD